MKQIFFSIRLFAFGFFCDMCSSFCTYLAEKCLDKNKSLNKKLLTFMSNFSGNNLIKWQAQERRFLKQFLGKGAWRLP